jgi:hypothetical protein
VERQDVYKKRSAWNGSQSFHTVEANPMRPSRTYQSERVQKLLESEPRLRTVLGPRDVNLFTRVGRRVSVSAGVLAVVKAMEEAGHRHLSTAAAW